MTAVTDAVVRTCIHADIKQHTAAYAARWRANKNA